MALCSFSFPKIDTSTRFIYMTVFEIDSENVLFQIQIKQETVQNYGFLSQKHIKNKVKIICWVYKVIC